MEYVNDAYKFGALLCGLHGAGRLAGLSDIAAHVVPQAVAFLILATFLGLNIGAVVLIHEGSTLIVVGNALRLLNFERGKEHHGIDHEDRPTA